MAIIKNGSRCDLRAGKEIKVDSRPIMSGEFKKSGSILFADYKSIMREAKLGAIFTH